MALTKKEPKKSQSERLRGVFYQHYSRKDEGYETFDEYYHHKMELLIDHYKNKLS